MTVSDGIDLATKIVGPATEYPAAYATVKEIWRGFIEDPSSETQDYVSAVADQISAIQKHNVPEDDRSDVIIAAFWAASAETVINQRSQNATQAEEDIRNALERVWAKLGD